LRLQGTWTNGQGDSYIPPQLCLRGYKYEMNDPLHAQLGYLKHFSKLIFFK